jgi:hypothetical protein
MGTAPAGVAGGQARLCGLNGATPSLSNLANTMSSAATTCVG